MRKIGPFLTAPSPLAILQSSLYRVQAHIQETGEGVGKSKKPRFGYRAKCQFDSWSGQAAKTEREASKMYVAHAVAQHHVEIRKVPITVVVTVVEAEGES